MNKPKSDRSSTQGLATGLPYKEGVTGSSPVPPTAKSTHGGEGVSPKSPNADRTSPQEKVQRRYRKKAVEVEAVQWTGGNREEVEVQELNSHDVGWAVPTTDLESFLDRQLATLNVSGGHDGE